MQVFAPSANLVARASIALVVASFVVGLLVWYAIVRSDYQTHIGFVREQPVPFSHEHHVARLGLDCRYCHTSVEDSSFAGLPSTGICMNCHSQIWTESPLLEPVRQSYATGTPLVWTRVNSLPEFVYFNHSIHVAKGVGCSVCHGAVDQMPLMHKSQTLFMQWCLACHRNPADQIRPRDKVFDMTYTPPADQRALGQQLAEEYQIRDSRSMIECNTCHR